MSWRRQNSRLSVEPISVIRFFVIFVEKIRESEKEKQTIKLFHA